MTEKLGGAWTRLEDRMCFGITNWHYLMLGGAWARLEDKMCVLKEKNGIV